MSSSRLGVKRCHLQKTFQGDNPKPALTPSLEAISGLFWHPRKLGWCSKKHRQYHLLPRAAVQAGKLEKRQGQATPNPGVLRQYKGVTYSKAKKRWLAQSFDEHTGTYRQIHGTFHTPESAARALADWMGVEDVKDFEKGAKWHLKCDVLLDIQ